MDVTQFDVPVHPAMVPLSSETIERGKAAIIKCRNILEQNSNKTRKTSVTNTADMRLAAGGTAMEYKAYLQKISRESAICSV